MSDNTKIRTKESLRGLITRMGHIRRSTAAMHLLRGCCVMSVLTMSVLFAPPAAGAQQPEPPELTLAQVMEFCKPEVTAFEEFMVGWFPTMGTGHDFTVNLVANLNDLTTAEGVREENLSYQHPLSPFVGANSKAAPLCMTNLRLALIEGRPLARARSGNGTAAGGTAAPKESPIPAPSKNNPNPVADSRSKVIAWNGRTAMESCASDLAAAFARDQPPREWISGHEAQYEAMKNGISVSEMDAHVADTDYWRSYMNKIWTEAIDNSGFGARLWAQPPGQPNTGSVSFLTAIAQIEHENAVSVRKYGRDFDSNQTNKSNYFIYMLILLKADLHDLRSCLARARTPQTPLGAGSPNSASTNPPAGAQVPKPTPSNEEVWGHCAPQRRVVSDLIDRDASGRGVPRDAIDNANREVTKCVLAYINEWTPPPTQTNAPAASTTPAARSQSPVGDAHACIKMERSLVVAGYVFSNVCGDPVEFSWCFSDADCRTAGTLALEPGKTWEESFDKGFRWLACHGPNTTTWKMGESWSGACKAPVPANMSTSAQAGGGNSSPTPNNPSSNDRSKVIAGNGRTAMECVTLETLSKGDSRMGSGGRVLLNGCSDAVEITWCYVSGDCRTETGSSWTLQPGKSWPVSAEKEIRWGACHGAGTAAMEKGSFGLRLICKAPDVPNPRE